MRYTHPAFLICALPAVLVGCGTFEEPDPVAPDVTPPAAWQAGSGEPEAAPIGWLDTFDDPVLADLIEEALENNRDLRAAAARVDEAWALAQQAGAALAPGLSAVAGATRTGASEGPGASSFDIALQARWEVDLWGRLRTGQSAAEASAEATEADYRHARQSLAAAVARAYFLGVEARLQREAAATPFAPSNSSSAVTRRPRSRCGSRCRRYPRRHPLASPPNCWGAARNLSPPPQARLTRRAWRACRRSP